MITTAHTVFADDAFRLAKLDNCIAATWHDAPTVARLDEMQRCEEQIKDRFDGRTFLLNFMVAGTPRFTSEVREKAAEMTAMEDNALATAHIVLVSGIKGAATRGFLTTVLLIGRPKTPTKVFASLEDAAPWLLPKVSVDGLPAWSSERLQQVANEALRPLSKRA